MRTLFLLIFLPTMALAQSGRQVGVDCTALFPFDPLSSRYIPGSLSQVAQYVQQWRAVDSISLTISPQLSLGYRLYDELVDSTLDTRVFNYFSPCKLGSITQPIDFTQMPHSKGFTDYFNEDIQRIKRFFATPITQLSDTINITDCYYGASQFASLFHKFQLSVACADVSFFAPPSKQGKLNPNIYINDIYSLFRYDNTLVTCSMTGRQIKEHLQKTYSKRYYIVVGESSDLVRYRTPHYMHTSASGLSYRVDLTKGRITDFSLPLDSVYKVVMNSFEARTQPIVQVIGDYRLLLIKWLMRYPKIECEIIEQWKLSPERWIETISKREQDYYKQQIDL